MATNNDNDISQIIAELSKIDNAAENVLTNIDADKQAYSDKIKNMTTDFDTDLEDNIRKQLSDYESSLKQKNRNELDAIREETNHSINALELWYEKNHSSVAQDIVNSFVKE